MILHRYIHPLELKTLLKEVTGAKDARQREILKILQEDYFKFSFGHNKPSNLGQSELLKDSEASKFKSEIDSTLIDFATYAEKVEKNEN